MALIQCPECNKEISDKVKSCPQCGYPLVEETKPISPQPSIKQTPPISTPPQVPKKKKRGCLISAILLFIFACGMGFGIYQITQNPEKYQEGGNVEIVFDASQYSYITKDELIEKLGEPTGIYDTIYTYAEMEFTVSNDVVTKFKYLPNEPVSYKNQDDIFYMFGVNPNKDNIKKVVDTNITYKFHSVSDDVYEFEVHGVNEDEKTFDIVFINFQESFN